MNPRFPSTRAMLLCTLAVTATSPVLADDPFDPPADYYLTATGTGDTLKANLRDIIFRDWRVPGTNKPEHQFNSYSAAVSAFRVLDEDPTDDTRMIEFYTGQSIGKFSSTTREHVWPRSKGVGSNEASRAFADYHMLRPCDFSVNGDRSNNDFGLGGGQWDPNTEVGQSAVWNINDPFDFRGEVARTLFYGATRYEAGDEPDTQDLELTPGGVSTGQLGDLDDLINWHFQEPPTDRERRRNHLVYTDYQGNRNPFVDNPHFVWTIFGVPEYGGNNSQIHLFDTPTSGGGTLIVGSLGDFIRGANAVTTFDLRKSFSHPTTFQLETQNGATVEAIATDTAPNLDRHFTIPDGSNQIVTIQVGYDGPAGAVDGRVIVDNTDLSSAGTGRGAADGDDTFIP